MSSVADLLGEADALDGAAAPQAVPEPTPAAGGPETDSAAELKPILVPLVGIVANELCDRRRVTRLEADETDLLAEAMLNLADAYDLKVKDPKVAAWLGLGGAAALIYKNRRQLPAPEAKPDAAVAA